MEGERVEGGGFEVKMKCGRGEGDLISYLHVPTDHYRPKEPSLINFYIIDDHACITDKNIQNLSNPTFQMRAGIKFSDGNSAFSDG